MKTEDEGKVMKTSTKLHEQGCCRKMNDAKECP